MANLVAMAVLAACVTQGLASGSYRHHYFPQKRCHQCVRQLSVHSSTAERAFVAGVGADCHARISAS